jgi:hypothetical protein
MIALSRVDESQAWECRRSVSAVDTIAFLVSQRRPMAEKRLILRHDDPTIACLLVWTRWSARARRRAVAFVSTRSMRLLQANHCSVTILLLAA